MTQTWLEINQVNYGSTGNIMLDIAEAAENEGITVYTACPDSRLNRRKHPDRQIVIGHMAGHKLSRILAWGTGCHDLFSVVSTWNFLRKLKKLHITNVHLHNLHGSFLNLPMLFRYLSKNDIGVLWTLHDCWALTGQCPHYDFIGCDRWKTGCHDCPQLRSVIDRSAMLWRMKKRAFTSVKTMTLAAPSEWMAQQIRASCLGRYPCRVLYNGIDLETFRSRKSAFREKYNIRQTYLVAAAAMVWGTRKGLEYICELAERLDSRQYCVVVVGTDETVDQSLPPRVISIHRTDSREALAEIYSAADVFANPTMEETLGLVNLEALACGTPVVTFNTGGSPETIDRSCGIAVPRGDSERFREAIEYVCTERPFSREQCRKQAQKFDRDLLYRDYVELYRTL